MASPFAGGREGATVTGGRACATGPPARWAAEESSRSARETHRCRRFVGPVADQAVVLSPPVIQEGGGGGVTGAAGAAGAASAGAGGAADAPPGIGGGGTAPAIPGAGGGAVCSPKERIAPLESSSCSAPITRSRSAASASRPLASR